MDKVMILCQFILQKCPLNVLVATGLLITLETIKDGLEIQVFVDPVSCIGVSQPTNSLIFLGCEIHGAAIKKTVCFYDSFPATSMTKRRVGH
jgi:hypothetical protein